MKYLYEQTDFRGMYLDEVYSFFGRDPDVMGKGILIYVLRKGFLGLFRLEMHLFYQYGKVYFYYFV